MAEAKAKKGKKHQELTETLQRLQADFENYKKRDEKEKQNITQVTTAAVLQRLLPIMDAFELALKNKDNHEQFAQGVEMIHKQLSNTFKEFGVKPIDVDGKRFDPHKHEVLMQETKNDCEDDIITEELQKGYMFHNQILRTSKVKIAKNHKEDKAKHDS